MSANSVIAAQPSYVILPRESELNGKSFTYVIEFLQWKFAQINADVWHARMTAGKVHWQNGELINASTHYQATKRVYYYREVVAESKVPFKETILHQDDHCIVAYKPHFLPVTPGGNYVNECLLHRLRISTGIDTIAPAHRLDKDTAGIILFTVNPDVRAQYHQLFIDGNITKTYQAIAKLSPELLSRHLQGELTLPFHWTVKNCIKPSNPSFTMAIVDGAANSHSEIKLIAVRGELGLFELSPITGKTHQLRVHMQSLAMPILNDRFYPQLQPKGPDNFAKPLQLLAQKLAFVDPITKQQRSFSANGLTWNK